MHAIAERTRAPVLSAGLSPQKGSREEHDADFAAYLAARQPALLRTAYALTGNRADAEDLLQTALAKLYLSWGRVRDREAVDAYVRRILVNENNSLWRRAFKRREVAVEAVPDRMAASDGPAAAHDSALWSFVQSLPPKQRAVVVLRYYEELSEAETADVLGISVGTVKSQASRALAALRARAPQSLNPSSDKHSDSGEEQR